MAVNDYTNVVVGPAAVWYAPVGEALPDETTVAYGGTWGGNWAQLGFTKTPISFGYQTTVFEVEVEQVTGVIKQTKTKEVATIETVLAELVGANLALATDGTLTSTAAGASQKAFEQVVAGGDPTISEYAWGFEGEYVDDAGASFPIRFFVYRGSAIMNGQLTFAKADYPGIPLQVKALNDTSKAKGAQIYAFQRVTAAATS